MAVLVVTGAARGLGRALALGAAARGFDLGVCDIDAAGLGTLERESALQARRICRELCDLTDSAQRTRFLDAIERELGSPADIWINCAGIARGSPNFEQLPDGMFERMLAINVAATAATCLAVLQRLRARGRGALWNVVGAGADGQFVPGMHGYATTKCALQYFTDGLARESGSDSITIGSISPGLVLTEAVAQEFAQLPPEARPARAAWLNVIGDPPQEAARWILDALVARPANGTRLERLTRRALFARRMRQRFQPRDIVRASPHFAPLLTPHGDASR